MSANREVALQYGARGRRVFPLHNVILCPDGTVLCSCRAGAACDRKGKHPRWRKDGPAQILHGHKDASADPAKIEAWWGLWPDAGIGFATGGGITVLDLDGSAGIARFQTMLAEHPDTPNTLTARTGNGAHLYWTDSSGTRLSAHDHIDVRGEGSYVAAPPTLHRSGRRYQWVDQLVPIAPLPTWLREWMLADKKTEQGGKERKPRSAQMQSSILAELGAPPTHLAWATNESGIQKSEVIRPLSVLSASPLGSLPWSAHEEARLRGALSFIPANLDGKTWHNYGRALFDLQWIQAGVNVGFALWDEWSETSTGRADGGGFYKGREDLEKRWASFGNESTYTPRVTVASIFKLASDYGWNGEIIETEPQIIKPVVELNGHISTFVSVNPIFNKPNNIIWRDVDKHGNPRATCVNTRLAIAGLGLDCRYDKFHDRMTVAGEPIGQWSGELTDTAVHALRCVIHQVFGFDPGTISCHDAAVQECLMHAFDPVTEYLDQLVWDGVGRIATWLTTYMRAVDTPLYRAFGGLMLLAAVRRAKHPGVKFDQIMVLIGPEGRDKSSAIEVLANAAGEGNFSDQKILGLDDRAQQEHIQGIWLYEIADLAGISKAEVEAVKAFASRRVDRARPAYARSRQDKPRRCVFFATTNSETFLKSPTGNRRFWPVTCGRVDIEALRRDRDQLWAEAVALERTGFSLMLPERLWSGAATLQAERLDSDPWDDILADMRPKDKYPRADGGDEYRVSARDVLEIWLKLPPERMTDVTAKRIANVLRRLGWDGPKVMRFARGDASTLAKAYTRPV